MEDNTASHLRHLLARRPGMPEACPLANIPEEALPRTPQAEPSSRPASTARGAAYPVLPTARPIVALAITPAIRGFSCSRRSEYSYHCCPYGT